LTDPDALLTLRMVLPSRQTRLREHG